MTVPVEAMGSAEAGGAAVGKAVAGTDDAVAGFGGVVVAGAGEGTLRSSALTM